MSLAALEQKLADPLWRLTSGELYKIATADGSGVIPFQPRPEQIEVIEALLAGRNVMIPKARRLGMSTTLGVYSADRLMYCPQWQGSLVDQNQADASRKLDRIVRVALENQPRWLLNRVKWVKSNDSQITINFAGTGERSFYAGMNARGGSNNWLWVSEWGPIQYEDPKRSAKIRSGALPSARHGLTAVETTWMGGKGGDLWELIEPSLTGKADDWRVMFFPWWVDPRNIAPVGTMDAEAEAYFTKIAARLERDGITLTDAQRRWWAQERRAQGIFMARENPTFLDECWSAPIQGAVYAAKIEQARAEGRIGPIPVDANTPVHTSWDLGSPENTVVWYWQIVGREIRFIDCDRGDRGTLTERVAGMLAKGYNLGKHYLPHDAQQTERSGTTFASELVRAGLPGNSVVTVPRTGDVWIGINHGLELFSALSFRSPQCDSGLDALGCYRTRRQGEGVLATDLPVHDFSSHVSDAARVMFEAHKAGLVAFKHVNTDSLPSWYHRPEKRKRQGMKPIRVSAGAF